MTTFYDMNYRYLISLSMTVVRRMVERLIDIYLIDSWCCNFMIILQPKQSPWSSRWRCWWAEQSNERCQPACTQISSEVTDDRLKGLFFWVDSNFLLSLLWCFHLLVVICIYFWIFHFIVVLLESIWQMIEIFFPVWNFSVYINYYF